MGCHRHPKSKLFINIPLLFIGIVPIPSEQPTGCRADTQIVCPDLKTRICEVERCDGVENCPKNPNEAKSWDELGCISFTNVTFEPPKPTTTASTTSTTITLPRKKTKRIVPKIFKESKKLNQT